jgi:hypothetical protein
VRNLARIGGLVAVTGVAVWAVWNATRPETPAPEGGPRTGTASPGADWRPEGTGGDPPVRKPPTAPAAKAAPTLPSEMSDAGTPTRPGQEVAVGVPWRKGWKARYEIEDAVVQKDKGTGALNAFRTTHRVAVDVLEGDGSAGARIRLVVESIRDQGLYPDGRLWDYDSRVGDLEGVLEDPVSGPRARLRLSVRGKPIELRLDGAGRIVDVDGIEAWREAYFAEAERIASSQRGPLALRAEAPSRAILVHPWVESLFPPLGGGTLKAGTPRPFVLRQPVVPPWDVVWTGTLDAARDDADAFRLDARAKPEAERGPGGESVGSSGIEKIVTPGSDDALRGRWRFARAGDGGAGGLLEGQLDQKHELWISQAGGRDAQGNPRYRPTFVEIERRVIIRRTDVPPGGK